MLRTWDKRAQFAVYYSVLTRATMSNMHNENIVEIFAA